MWSSSARGGSLGARCLLLFVAAAVLLVIHATTVESALFWRHPSGDPYRVTVLVPFVVAWLVWSRRSRLLDLPATTWWPGLLALAGASALWLLADLSDINAVRQIAVVVMVQALVATLLGPAIARALAFPLLYLFFAVDVFDPLVDPLMQWTAGLGVLALRLTGIPVVLDGLTFVTSFGRWLVTETCSGVDYLLVFAMAATVFASMAFRSAWRRISFVLAALAAAVLANGFRTWGIVFAAYLNNGVDNGHDLIGRISFAVLLILLFAAGRYFSQSPDIGIAPSTTAPAYGSDTARSATLAALAAIALAGAGSAAASTLRDRPASSASFDGCRVATRELVEQDGSAVVRVRTQCDGAAGRRRIAAVASDALDAVAPGALREKGEAHVVDSRSGKPLLARTLTTVGELVPCRVTYWYQVGDAATGSWLAMKLRLALALLQGQDSRVTVVTEVQLLSERH